MSQVKTILSEKQFSVLRVVCGENFENSNGGPVSASEVCMTSQYRKQAVNLLQALVKLGMVTMSEDVDGCKMVTPTSEGLYFYQENKNRGV